MEGQKNDKTKNYIIAGLSIIIILLLLKSCPLDQKGRQGVANNSPSAPNIVTVTNEEINKEQQEEVTKPETQNENIITDATETIPEASETNDQYAVTPENKKEEDNKTPKKDDAADENLWKDVKNKNTLYSYNRYLKEFPTGNHKPEAEKGVVDKEVEGIFSGEHGKLPPMDAKTPKAGVNGKLSFVDIKNDTEYELVLRYSGAQSQKIVLKAGEKKSFTIPNGDYKMTATVNAEHVKNYGSIEKFRGMNYSSEFYLKSKGNSSK